MTFELWSRALSMQNRAFSPDRVDIIGSTSPNRIQEVFSAAVLYLPGGSRIAAVQNCALPSDRVDIVSGAPLEVKEISFERKALWLPRRLGRRDDSGRRAGRLGL